VRKRIAIGVLAVLFVLVGVALAAGAPGAYERYPRVDVLWPAQQAKAPGWTRPCWYTARWTDKQYCEHVSGRVVWIQRRDPDGDGDRHVLIAGHYRLRIVKLVWSLRVPGLPKVGTRVDAVGWLMRGGSGHDEINAQRIAWGGRSWMTQAG
jgi:hypothetical protein